MLLDLHLINLYKQMVFRNLKISISNPLVKNNTGIHADICPKTFPDKYAIPKNNIIEAN